MSSSVVHLNLLLKIPPEEVLFDFLTQCGLPLQFGVIDTDDYSFETLRIATAIERAQFPVRDCILASMRHIALLADEAGLEALRTVNEARPRPSECAAPAGCPAAMRDVDVPAPPRSLR